MLARLRPPAPLRFRSIQTKLTFWFSLVMLVTITSVGFVYYWTTIREIKAQALFLSENTVDQMNRSVGFFLDNAERLSLCDPSVQRILRAKSGDSESDRQSDTNEMNYRLLSYASPWNQVQGIYVFSTDGRLYYASKEKSPRLHYKLAEEPWYGLIANGELKALEIWPSGPETTVFGKSETVFSLIRPINDFPVPSVLGYLKIDIKAQSLDYALGQEESGLRSFSHFYIADRNGHVIYDAEGAATGRAMPELAAYAGAGLRSGETEWAGERSLFVSRPVNGADWQMVAFVPYDSVVGKIKQTRNVTLLIAAAALLAVIVVSYMISTGITRPLRLLMRNMQKVEMGNFKVRLRPERNDEVGHLGQMFNAMVQNLDVLIKEAYESKLREKDARLLALQAQINPHFLFNTLNMIKAIGRKREAPEIVGVVESLAELFRYSMKEWNKTVPLAKELEFLRHYIRIQQIRFKRRFVFYCDVPPELAELHIVKLSLQPIVENAFKHGIEGMGEGAEVRVSAADEGGRLAIRIADNGGGMPPDRLRTVRRLLAASHSLPSESPDEGVGIGLANIDRRIKLFFGDEFGLRIDSGSEGTTVTLQLPCAREGRMLS